jgi:hypothetical protein
MGGKFLQRAGQKMNPGDESGCHACRSAPEHTVKLRDRLDARRDIVARLVKSQGCHKPRELLKIDFLSRRQRRKQR